jgi:CRP-like cAMP-binding protein
LPAGNEQSRSRFETGSLEDDIMDISKAIADTYIFETLNPEELSKVVDVMSEVSFKRGDIIMQEGREGDTMYILAEGEVGVTKSLTMKFAEDDYREAEKVLTRLHAENRVIFGEMALIVKDKRSATVVAGSDCSLIEIHRDDFLELIQGQPDMGVKILYKIAELLVNRIKESSQDVIRLTTALSIALSR